MDKYVEKLSNLHFDLLHIAQSYAIDNILRALLHKNAGLINFIEDILDSDYYYLVDWTDMRIKQCNKSPYKMKGFEFSHESKSVIKEAANLSDSSGLSHIDAKCLLAALLSPGIAYSYEQLKTMPLKAEKVLATIKADGNENQNRDKINASSEIISNDFAFCSFSLFSSS